MTDAGTEPWHDPNVLRRHYHGQGKTLEQVGDDLGCSRATVARWMERFGIERRESPQFEEKEGPWNDPERLNHLYREKGLSCRDIAQNEFEGEISWETVRVRLHEFDIIELTDRTDHLTATLSKYSPDAAKIRVATDGGRSLDPGTDQSVSQSENSTRSGGGDDS